MTRRIATDSPGELPSALPNVEWRKSTCAGSYHSTLHRTVSQLLRVKIQGCRYRLTPNPVGFRFAPG